MAPPPRPGCGTVALAAGAGLAIGLAAGAALVRLLWRTDRALPLARSARRVGGICRLRPEMKDQYTQLHDHTWNEVMERMYRSNMRNFVVYLHPETNLMFSHWEYVGRDDQFDADMAAIAADPVVRRWWSYCEPCQSPFSWEGPPPSQGGDGGPGGNWWDPLVCLNSCGAWPVTYAAQWPDPDFTPQNPRGALSSKDNPPPIHNRPAGN